MIFPLILLADAKNVASNDANSPQGSQMPAKLQQLALESQEVVTRSVDRNTRAEEEQNLTCDPSCPSTIVTYTRWGNSTCPPGADIIYSGVVAGSWFDHQGAAVDPLCLPLDPQYLKFQDGYQNYGLLYGAEYEIDMSSPINHARNRNVPCAMCQVNGRTNKIMIPSRYECPSGWRREYYGYLMAGFHDHKAATQYTCMDESLEQIPGSASNINGRLFHTVEAVCNHFIPCSDKELTCVVCTK